MARFDLDDAARKFAGLLSEVVNKTIASNVRLTPLATPSGAIAVAYKPDATRLRSSEPFALNRARDRPALFMTADYVLSADTENEYLQVVSSIVVVSCGNAEGDFTELFHVDYERDKTDDYPEAHWQVNAWSDSWAQAMGPKGRLKKLHLPVGGRRFRPSLEDVAEFLIREGMVKGAARAQERLEATRDEFMRKQLRAAVRRDPETAIAALREIGALRD